MRQVLRTLLGLLFAVLFVSTVTAGPAVATGDAERVVRVGTEGTYPPFSFHDPADNQLTGYDIEVIKAVAERTNWDLQFVEAPWDSIFPALDAGRVDLIANQVSFNEERDAQYALSDPYTFSEGVIVTAADTDDITTLEDIEGKVAAQSTTSNWAEVARNAGAKIEAVDQFSQAVKLLEQGRVDVIVNDNIAVLDYLASTGSTNIKIAGVAEGESSEQVLAFREADRDTLMAEANAALKELAADGTLTEISESYFKADVSTVDGGEADLSGGRGQRSTWEILTDTAGPMLTAAIKVTIPLTAISFALGLALALVVALARMSSSLFLSLPARAFISIIRGTPLLLQLFIVFFALPEIGVQFEPFPSAVLAFSLNVAGYAAEIIRSAIIAVPRGQFEAAQTIGLSYPKALRRIILPQATRTAVPPLSNTLLSLVKDTSLASVVLLTELFRVADQVASETNRFMALFIFAGLYYWVICFVLSGVQRRLENYLERFAA